MADLAYRKVADFCRLLELWSGFAPVNSFTRAIEADENVDSDQLIATLSQQDLSNDSLSSDPLLRASDFRMTILPQNSCSKLWMFCESRLSVETDNDSKNGATAFLFSPSSAHNANV